MQSPRRPAIRGESNQTNARVCASKMSPESEEENGFFGEGTLEELRVASSLTNGEWIGTTDDVNAQADMARVANSTEQKPRVWQ